MVDIGDSKSPGRMPLRVQVPSQVPHNPIILIVGLIIQRVQAFTFFKKIISIYIEKS